MSDELRQKIEADIQEANRYNRETDLELHIMGLKEINFCTICLDPACLGEYTHYEFRGEIN